MDGGLKAHDRAASGISPAGWIWRRTLPSILLILYAATAFATTAEDAYLAARDRDIASLAKIEDAKDTAARDAAYAGATKDLETRLKAILGPVAPAGYPADAKLNLDSLYPDDEGFGMLDGLVFGESESAKNVLVTSDGLFDKWLSANRKATRNDARMPADLGAVLKSEIFYSMAVSTDSAVVHYTDIPVVAPPGAKFAYAMLSARTQDESPSAPDEIFVALEYGGRVFIANERLAKPLAPITACKALKAAGLKKADALNGKGSAMSGPEGIALSEQADKLRNDVDAAARACFGRKVKGTAAFKAVVQQAAARVTALTR